MQLASDYLSTKKYLIEAGYADEIDWQASVSLDKLTESDFIREAAWVVLSSGMRETVVRRKFPALSSAFLNWVDAKMIAATIQECCQNALSAYRSPRKIGAIAQIVDRVAVEGFDSIKDRVRRYEIEFLREFPFMGPITAFHLAKNIGLPVVKADRHLCRVAKHFGYETPDRICRIISEQTGDPLPVVDLVLWRYAALSSGSREAPHVVPVTPYLTPLVPGRVAPGDCSPGAPTDPYVPFQAYGSSYHELATGRLPE
jgi:hypothetical protein